MTIAPSLSPASPVTAAAPPTGAGLTQRRKAAMVVQLLLSEGRALNLSHLPEDVQVSLARELGALRLVDRDTLAAVAAEFADRVERVGLAVTGGVEGALNALSDRISPTTATRLRAEASGRPGGDPWTRLVALEPEELLPIMTEESIEVAAVTLSKLPVAKAATLLGLLPGDRARRITYAVSQTQDVSPVAVARIGEALVAEHCVRTVQAFDNPAPSRVGAILNSSQSDTRSSLLDALAAEDPAFAEAVRKAIFTFPDIRTRIAAADIPKLSRAVDSAVLVTALAAAQAAGGDDAAAADHILSNMSTRMADGLREEIGERGRIRRSDAEAAMSQVVAAIRGQIDAGDISIVMPDEEDED